MCANHGFIWLFAVVLTWSLVAGAPLAENSVRIEGGYIKKLSFGNLRKLKLKGGNGRYFLNDSELPGVSSDTIEFETADRHYRVRATFLETVLISKSRTIKTENQDLLRTWSQKIPLVAQIVAQQDSLGSMKPVVYALLQPKDKRDLRWQEELVLLWSSDPTDDSKIGDTQLWPPVPFPGQAVDVQYRGIREPAKQLLGKIILQILYLKDREGPITLGAFVIVSKPSGDYEFYLVPRSLLDQIVINSKERTDGKAN